VAFHNAERRIQRTSLLADSMRGIVWWQDGRLGRQVSDAFDRTFAVVDGVFDQIRFSLEVKESPWHAAPPEEVVKVTPPIPAVPGEGSAAPDVGEAGASDKTPTVDQSADEGAVARARAGYDPAPKTQSEEDEGRIHGLIAQIKGGGLATVLALLAFLLWGAWHAIQPGHGKTLVASYLIGTHGRPRDAITLGITVTLAHVSGVFVFLGLYLLVESINPELVSRSAVQEGMVIVFGAVIFLMGLGLVFKASGGAGHHHDIFGRHVGGDHHHDHDHGSDHPHAHAHGQELDPGKLSTWEIIRLGILGGMLPCPAAVTLALVMMTQGEAVLGVVLLLVFSIGLAAVLSAIGLVMVATRSYLKDKASKQSPRFLALVSKLPLLGGLAITLIGFVMIMAALHRMEVLDLRAIMG
jgi:ABC-type nickel/cobalt efflux system permease component RcnA